MSYFGFSAHSIRVLDFANMVRAPSVARPLRPDENPHHKQRRVIYKKEHLVQKIPNVTFLKQAQGEGFTLVSMSGRRWQDISAIRFFEHGGDRKASKAKAARTMNSKAKAKVKRLRPRHVVTPVEPSEKVKANSMQANVSRKLAAKVNESAPFKFRDTIGIVVNMPAAKRCKTMSKAHLSGLLERMIIPRGICGKQYISRAERDPDNKAWHILTLTKAGQNQFGIKKTRIHCGCPVKAPSVWGCIQSHLKAIRNAQQLTCCASKYVAIFEDDFYFTVPVEDVALITETLLAKAAKAGLRRSFLFYFEKF